MKKTILIVALVLAAVAVMGIGAGVVFAQDVTPPYNGQGPMRNGEGPMHTFMVIEFAKKLEMNVNDINTRLAAGETMYDIALSTGVTAEEFPAVMTEVPFGSCECSCDGKCITQAGRPDVVSWKWSGRHGHRRLHRYSSRRDRRAVMG